MPCSRIRSTVERARHNCMELATLGRDVKLIVVTTILDESLQRFLTFTSWIPATCQNMRQQPRQRSISRKLPRSSNCYRSCCCCSGSCVCSQLNFYDFTGRRLLPLGGAGTGGYPAQPFSGREQKQQLYRAPPALMPADVCLLCFVGPLSPCLGRRLPPVFRGLLLYQLLWISFSTLAFV